MRLAAEAREGEQGAYTLHGDAAILDDGQLSLTGGSPTGDYHTTGSLAIDRPQLSASIVSSFSARFGLQIGGGSGGLACSEAAMRTCGPSFS